LVWFGEIERKLAKLSTTTFSNVLPLNYFMLTNRVSSKRKKKFFGSNRNKLKQDLFRVCFGLFRETKKKLFSVCFGVSNLYRNNRNKQNCFETNRNNLEFSEKQVPKYALYQSFQNFSWTEQIFLLKKDKDKKKKSLKTPYCISYCSWRCRFLNK
jgi:hypothetical protein